MGNGALAGESVVVVITLTGEAVPITTLLLSPSLAFVEPMENGAKDRIYVDKFHIAVAVDVMGRNGKGMGRLPGDLNAFGKEGGP